MTLDEFSQDLDKALDEMLKQVCRTFLLGVASGLDSDTMVAIMNAKSERVASEENRTRMMEVVVKELGVRT